ncbi:hypothetical protein [Thioalkalivibrio sp. ALE11]|uniref:hypothetical protein n=1 Tax=Thioalkalivibrio sp. ALE11 TaxID=1265494 RepID=UPI0003729838
MVQGMHLTRIGADAVLLEPGEGLDPGEPDRYLVALGDYLQAARARRLIYDLDSVPVVDALYYDWLKAVHGLCRVIGVEMVVANMAHSVAYALAARLDEVPPFACARDVERAR